MIQTVKQIFLLFFSLTLLPLAAANFSSQNCKKIANAIVANAGLGTLDILNPNVGGYDLLSFNSGPPLFFLSSSPQPSGRGSGYLHPPTQVSGKTRTDGIYVVSVLKLGNELGTTLDQQINYAFKVEGNSCSFEAAAEKYSFQSVPYHVAVNASECLKVISDFEEANKAAIKYPVLFSHPEMYKLSIAATLCQEMLPSI